MIFVGPPRRGRPGAGPGIEPVGPVVMGVVRPIEPVEVVGWRSPLAPLLEQERHPGRRALVAQGARPVRVHRPGARAGLAASDYPVETELASIVVVVVWPPRVAPVCGDRKSTRLNSSH